MVNNIEETGKRHGIHKPCIMVKKKIKKILKHSPSFDNCFFILWYLFRAGAWRKEKRCQSYKIQARTLCKVHSGLVSALPPELLTPIQRHATSSKGSLIQSSRRGKKN